VAETTQGALEAEMKEIFAPYRGFFNRNPVMTNFRVQSVQLSFTILCLMAAFVFTYSRWKLPR
jgi:hypothetical protein